MQCAGRTDEMRSKQTKAEQRMLKLQWGGGNSLQPRHHNFGGATLSKVVSPAQNGGSNCGEPLQCILPSQMDEEGALKCGGP